MKKETNLKEGKVTIEMNFEEEAAICVAIISEIIELKKTREHLKENNIDGKFNETIEAANRRIETLEQIKANL